MIPERSPIWLRSFRCGKGGGDGKSVSGRAIGGGADNTGDRKKWRRLKLAMLGKEAVMEQIVGG